MSDDDAKRVLAGRLRYQQAGCEALGSPLYADVLGHAAADVESGGPTWRILAGHEGDPGPSALALRFLGAVHRMVLSGDLPELAPWYASVGGTEPPATAWPAFRDALERNETVLRDGVERRVQTNEVGRAGALLGAFLLVAEATGLPLRMLEVGASAGLNMRWDRFHYRAGHASWGDHTSPVDLGDPFETGTPPLHVHAAVAERRGCDAAPVDATSDDGRLTLLSYVWPDQQRRLHNLAGAIDLARAVPAPVDRSHAAPWLAAQLAEPVPGVATVVYHSIVMQYLTADERAEIDATFEAAGAHATTAAPLARVQFEPRTAASVEFPVSVQTWPDGTTRDVATAGAHGTPVNWLV
jgi:hypothetical protein